MIDMNMDDLIPNIYHEIANKYPCSAEDLFHAVPFEKDPRIIELAAKMFGQGFQWYQVKIAMIRGNTCK